MQYLKYNLILNILELISSNQAITEKEMANILSCHERTIRRYIKIMKERGVLEIIYTKNSKIWIIKK